MIPKEVIPRIAGLTLMPIVAPDTEAAAQIPITALPAAGAAVSSETKTS